MMALTQMIREDVSQEAGGRWHTSEGVKTNLPLNDNTQRGEGGRVSNPDDTFFQCATPTCLAVGIPKTNFVLTPKSIYDMY